MGFKVVRNLMKFWCFFIGIGAVIGSIMMFISPDGTLFGMDGMLQYFQVLPFAEVLFQDFIFPGFALLVINGLTNFIAVTLIIIQHRYDAWAGMICGVLLMLWISIQFFIFEFNFMSTAYFVFGVLQFITALLYLNFKKQNTSKFDEDQYKNIS